MSEAWCLQILRRQSLQGGPVLGSDWEAVKFKPLNSGPPARLCHPPTPRPPGAAQLERRFLGELRSLSAFSLSREERLESHWQPL